MKRSLSILLAAALLLPAGCAPAAPAEEGEVRLSVVATTYPIYLLAREVTQGVEGVEVERLNTGSVSCLHDYTLSVDDVKKLERPSTGRGWRTSWPTPWTPLTRR